MPTWSRLCLPGRTKVVPTWSRLSYLELVRKSCFAFNDWLSIGRVKTPARSASPRQAPSSGANEANKAGARTPQVLRGDRPSSKKGARVNTRRHHSGSCLVRLDFARKQRRSVPAAPSHAIPVASGQHRIASALTMMVLAPEIPRRLSAGLELADLRFGPPPSTKTVRFLVVPHKNKNGGLPPPQKKKGTHMG